MEGARLVLVSALVLLVTWRPSEAHGAARDGVGESESAAALRRLAQSLGLPDEGRFAGRPLPPPPAFMLDLYNSVTDSRGRWRGHAPYHANVVRSVQETGPASDSLLHFKVGALSSSEELLEAELHVYVPHVPHDARVAASRRVRVWQVTQTGPAESLDTGLVTSPGGWAVFRVRGAVAAAAAGQAGRPPLTLRMTEETPGGGWRQLNITRRGQYQHHREPLLVLYSRNNRTDHHRTVNEGLVRHARSTSFSRPRRHIRPGHPAGCERRNLYVNFTEIGWSSIVAPSGYDAYHCVGQCELPLTSEKRPTKPGYMTNHAVVQSSVWWHSLFNEKMRQSREDRVARPSCVPSKLSNTVFLVLEENNVVLRNYKDMVAEECFCQ